jgi:hypothetical protein
VVPSRSGNHFIDVIWSQVVLQVITKGSEELTASIFMEKYGSSSFLQKKVLIFFQTTCCHIPKVILIVAALRMSVLMCLNVLFGTRIWVSEHEGEIGINTKDDFRLKIGNAESFIG